jgi:hypothetical protein
MVLVVPEGHAIVGQRFIAGLGIPQKIWGKSRRDDRTVDENHKTPAVPPGLQEIIPIVPLLPGDEETVS